jgi:hypothetical protein
MGSVNSLEGYQINVHGTYIESTGPAGAGIIVQEVSAKVIYECWCVMLIFPSAEEVEVFACQEGEQILNSKVDNHSSPAGSIQEVK